MGLSSDEKFNKQFSEIKKFNKQLAEIKYKR